MAKRITKRQAKQVVKAVKKMSPIHIIVAIIILIVAVGGYFVYTKLIKKPDLAPLGEVEFHFFTLGNASSGDSVYIRAGDNDILIDGGSDYDSIDDIESYVNQFVKDDTLEYVIVTHGDMDHIACFAGEASGESLFDKYEVKTIIDFPKTNKDTKVYNRYLSERQQEVDDGNTVHYTALECYKNENGAQRIYNLSADGNIKMEILYNYYYENNSNHENDYSVCLMFHHGSKKFLFTGDLEEKGEEKLVELNNLSQVEFYKAGHHGSKTSSHDVLLDVIKPKICVVPCVAGNAEYTDTIKNQFPTQDFIDRIAKHTKLVYVPSIGALDYINGAESGFVELNGDIVVVSTGEKTIPATDTEPAKIIPAAVTVKCEKNDTVLKDTAWFKQYRTTPAEWLN